MAPWAATSNRPNNNNNSHNHSNMHTCMPLYPIVTLQALIRMLDGRTVGASVRKRRSTSRSETENGAEFLTTPDVLRGSTPTLADVTIPLSMKHLKPFLFGDGMSATLGASILLGTSRARRAGRERNRRQRAGISMHFMSQPPRTGGHRVTISRSQTLPVSFVL